MTLPYPHDAAFKSAMSDARVARDFFQHYLPAVIQQTVNLNSLRLQAGSYIDETLRASETDILYAVDFKEKKSSDVYLYLLAEHQSTPDPWIAFRLLKYCCKIADQHLKQHKKA